MATLSRGALVSILLAGCAIEEPTTSSVEQLAQPHAVVGTKELVITDASVIAATEETTFDPAHPSGVTKHGAWSFGRLVHNMLPAGQRDSPLAASQLVLSWLATWETPQSPNTEVSAARARPGIRLQITNPWKAASGCADPANPATDATCVLDMTKAPFKLMAIFYRPDLRIVAGDDRSIGGEGRFVFQVIGPTLGVRAGTGVVDVMDPTVKPQKFTLIFEYSLPVTDDGQIITWAEKWHQLGAMPFGTAFNAHLLSLTRDFSGPDKDTRRPNGNALNQLRTNEVSLLGARLPAAGFVSAPQLWELREFHLTSAGLTPHTMNLEPSRDFDVAHAGQVFPEGTRSSELVAFLNANTAAVLASRHVIPAGMVANSTLVGTGTYPAWQAPGVASNVRDAFALATCAGCHRHETGIPFMHVTFASALVDPTPPIALAAEPTDSDAEPATDSDAAPATDSIVLSSFVTDQLGGERGADFAQLLVTKRKDLRDKPGLQPCR